MKSDELFGNDVFLEICSWMPAKAAIKVLSLSKSLYSLLSDPLFVEKQSIRSSLYDGGFFLDDDVTDKQEFHVLPSKQDGPGSNSSVGIPGRSLSFLEQFGRVLCSSQGLLLVKSTAETRLCGPNRILICNPATGSCSLLPEWQYWKSKPLMSDQFVLECHPRNPETDFGQSVYFPSDYTIIAPLLWEDNEENADKFFPTATDFAVYRNGKWEEEPFHLNLLETYRLHTEMPVVLFRGCTSRGLVLHYLCNSEPNLAGGDAPLFQEPYIVAYDLERKTVSRMFQLPKEAWKGRYGGTLVRIFKWRTTIGLASGWRRVLKVWMLEDYDRGQWRMVVLDAAGELGRPLNEENLVRCCVVNDTCLLFATSSRVYAYEIMDGQPSRIEPVAEHGYGLHYSMRYIPYANTLRPVCGPEGSVFNLGDKFI